MNEYEKQVYRRFAGLPDEEEQRLGEDNLNEIIQRDVVCECGLHPFCPIHSEEE
jgi:hypothetical protein